MPTSWRKFFRLRAVGSGLSREIKPLATALEPGALHQEQYARPLAAIERIEIGNLELAPGLRAQAAHEIAQFGHVRRRQ